MPPFWLMLCLLVGPSVIVSASPEQWERLLKSDKNGDGKISAEEYIGPRFRFLKLDANKDGFITRNEVSDGAAVVPSRRLDQDGDGYITNEEWRAFRAHADTNSDGILDREEFDAAIAGRPYRDKAPKVGALAPRIRVRLAGPDGEMIELGRGKRPTVLIFASWT